ncbi:MAG: FtsW/RodA/SpoVE family cell cycle protein [Alistipes sp.]|nr:FtsW/RodA/SpoVE family cell cycle protein [Alistipes sp.]
MSKIDNDKSQQAEAKKGIPSILSKLKVLPGDRVLWAIVTMFFAISLVAVYTASSQLGFREGTIDRELQRHFMTLCLSAVCLFGSYIIGASKMYRYTVVAYFVCLLMTIAPYFIGGATNHAHRWLNLGFFRFQPSELLKIGTILFLAAQLSAKRDILGKLHLLPSTFDVRKWNTPREKEIIKREVLPVVAPIALSCAVILPAHTSSALHIFLVSMVLIYIAGVRLKEIGKLIAVAGFFGLVMLAAFGRFDTVVNRFKAWFGVEVVEKGAPSTGGKDSYYSQMAIQNGGFFGVGAGRSMMRAKLTHPESDYLFAVIVEEFGLLISSVIILLYLWLFFRSLRIFERCEWLYAGLLVVGLALLVTSQAFIHVAVTLGILPETGQNLPFLTHGRTGMFCASIAVGLILSISRQVEQGTLLPPSQQSKNKHI